MRAGRATREDIRLGVCGEHGGDPDSIHFFHHEGLDYVSCSLFPVRVARLEAGRAPSTWSEPHPSNERTCQRQPRVCRTCRKGRHRAAKSGPRPRHPEVPT